MLFPARPYAGQSPVFVRTGAVAACDTLQGSIRAGLPGFLLCGLLCVALTCGPRPTQAQDNASNGTKSANGAVNTTDVAQLISDLDDIDILRPLLPLKLTPEELDRISTVVSTAQADYDKKFKGIAGPALAKLADQIHDVKDRALRGETIPKDFDALAKQAEAEILAKRKILDADTLVSVASALENILTPDQVKLAAKLDKDAQTRLGKVTSSTQRTEDQWFGLYVKDAILTVPRIAIVLKQMRAAANAKTVSGAGGK